MKRLLLIKPSEDLRSAITSVGERFERITGERLVIVVARSVLEFLRFKGEETFDMVFVDGTLEKPELNSLLATFDTSLLRRKMWLIVTPENHRNISNRLFELQIRLASKGFSPEFLYDTLLLSVNSSSARQIDTTVMKAIILGIRQAIKSNTNIAMTTGQTSDRESRKLVAEASAVVTFFGDGVVGAVFISAPRALLYALAERIFKDKNRNQSEAVYQDFCCEIMNQVLGIVRSNLSAQGFNLFAGINLAATGGVHRLVPRLQGRYQSCPFQFQAEQFTVTLFHAYRNVVFEERSAAGNDAFGKSVLDVRLLNEVKDVAVEVIRTATGMPTHAGAWHKKVSLNARSLHLSNGTGKNGSSLIGLIIEDGFAQRIREKFAKDGKAIDEDLPTRLFAKVLEVLYRQFQERSQSFDYYFHEACRIDLVGGADFTYSLKGSGFFVALPIHVGGFEMTLIFGQDSRHASGTFNAWPVVPAKKAG